MRRGKRVIGVGVDGGGGTEKRGDQAIGCSRGELTTKLHVVAIDDRTPLALSLTPGQWGDAPEGRQLLGLLGQQQGAPALLMDRAYEGGPTRDLAAVPPPRHRSTPWKYDRERYKERNVLGRLLAGSSASATSPPATTSSTPSSSASSTSP